MSKKVYKILIVDDSPADRRVYRRFLQTQDQYQFEVSEATTIAACLEECSNQEFDCLLLDFRLPDTDGLKALPDINEKCKAPIIFITGQPEPLVMTEAYRYGAVKYLSKDFLTSKNLLDAVFEALQLE